MSADEQNSLDERIQIRFLYPVEIEKVIDGGLPSTSTVAHLSYHMNVAFDIYDPGNPIW